MIASAWRSQHGVENAHHLRAIYSEAFAAIAELDALGHRLLKRAADGPAIGGIDRLVGIAIIRRLVTLFVGIRHLLEASAVEPAKLIVRAQFEALLAARVLVHGGRHDITPQLPSYQRTRESRARYYYAASLRQDIYRRQAALDRANQTPAVDRTTRRGLQQEIRQIIHRLDRYFPVQNRSFGPLACYPVAGNKPAYRDHRKWYSFVFRGPRRPVNVKQLASRLGWLSIYAVLYDALSQLTHPSSTTQDVSIEDGHADIHSPYLPDAFEFLVSWTCNWQGLALAYLTKTYQPSAFEDVRATQVRVGRVIDTLSHRLPMGLL